MYVYNYVATSFIGIDIIFMKSTFFTFSQFIAMFSKAQHCLLQLYVPQKFVHSYSYDTYNVNYTVACHYFVVKTTNLS